jgi:uncharacterized protein
MQPAFRIFADQKEITAAVRDRLLEMTVIDEAGIKSDQVKITLDDRRREDGAVAQLPDIGTTLAIALGYAGTSLADMGTYRVDEIDISHPPATLTVSAKAADMVGSFRSPKTRSWDETTLGVIVETIASEHGYTPKVSPELGGIAILHLDQTEESDMALLTRMAGMHDAVAKPVAGHLVLAKQGAAKSATDKDLPVLVLRARDLTSWSYTHSARKAGGSGMEAVGGVKAYWWDADAGERQEVVAGSPPYEELRYVHSTEANALAAVLAKLNKGERGQDELSLTLPGDTRLAAECHLSLPDLRPGLPTDWRITKVEHKLSGGGYVCHVECERFI